MSQLHRAGMTRAPLLAHFKKNSHTFEKWRIMKLPCQKSGGGVCGV
jgi:hypothetical protein